MVPVLLSVESVTPAASYVRRLADSAVHLGDRDACIRVLIEAGLPPVDEVRLGRMIAEAQASRRL